MGRLDNQVAVVTGAGNGLGEAIALRLAEEGARLVLSDIEADALADTASQITRSGGEAVTMAGDLTDESPAIQLVETAVERFGQVDILVNNLGGSRMTPMKRLGLPEEVANAVLFLASDEASYVSGHTLAVAGGR